MTTPPTPDPFAASLRELESRVADAEKTGEEMPPQVHEMIAHLRNLSDAMRKLEDSLRDGPPTAGS